MSSADEVLSADGLLAEFNAAEVLGAADVHTARLVGDLWEEPDDQVRLAVALVVRALRSGSVCLDITRLAELVTDTLEDPPTDLAWPEPAAWAEAIRRSPAIATGSGPGAGRPLRLVGDLLYLERYWRTEEIVRHHLKARQDSTTGFDIGTSAGTGPAPDEAAAAAVRRELDALFDDPALPRSDELGMVDCDDPGTWDAAAAVAALAELCRTGMVATPVYD
ncbi:MAG: hypothetical protein Q4F67_01760, partial [Propionibacteriaceae bacterium]|nr:hypothetical protein [Propionibacteriaceae bacterium]